MKQDAGCTMQDAGGERPRFLALGARVVLGGLFLCAGAMKARDPQLFALDVFHFDLVPWPAALAMGVYLPWVEIIAGLAVIARRLALGGLAIIAALNLVFSGALASAWARGLEISCGCYGETTERTNYPRHLLGNAAMLATAIWLLGREGKGRR